MIDSRLLRKAAHISGSRLGALLRSCLLYVVFTTMTTPSSKALEFEYPLCGLCGGFKGPMPSVGNGPAWSRPDFLDQT